MGKIAVMTDARFPEASEIIRSLTEAGYDVRIVPETIDLWDEAALTEFAAPLADDLVGVIHPAPPKRLGAIETVSEEDWEKAGMEGAVAALVVTKVFCGIFREKHKGSFIYLNSVHAEKPVGKGALFSVNCGAVEMLSKEACLDYGADDVNIFFVQRGIMADECDAVSDVSPIYCGVNFRYPNCRYPEKDHLNGLIAFLLTEAAAPLSGSAILADHGLTGYYSKRKLPEGGEA